jgi:hypothetical protein
VFSEFADCNNLTSVTISNSVTNIGDVAFDYCHSLTNVTLPNSVTNIGNWAFEGCASLTSVTIPDGVTSIGVAAFQYAGLTNVTIPSSVTNIGEGPFSGCSNLTAIRVETNNPDYSSVSGVLFDKSQTTLIQYPSGNVTTSYAIPKSVTSIRNGAFYGCINLTSVTIPDSLTSIGYLAFGDCGSLTSVTIPNSVTNIGYRAFIGCATLTSAYFQGNAPTVLSTPVFPGNTTAYYLPGTTGWGPTFAGIPTALWTLPYPLILNSSLGVRSDQFGFNVSWAMHPSVVVEASTDLGRPNWSPVKTNVLSGGTFYFSDPQWTNYPNRFYRIRSP